MAHFFQLLVLLLGLLSYITTAQNDTNETTTSQPTGDTSTTMLYTSRPTDTLSPTMEPTPYPNADPSPSPTPSPNIFSNTGVGNKVYTQKMKATCRSSTPGAITCKKVNGKQKAFWKSAGEGSTCQYAKGKDDCEVEIGDCEDIKEDERRRRRLLETSSSDIIGVTITYLIVLRDPSLVTAHEQRINNGEFDREFSETVNDEYDDVLVEVEFEEAQLGDADDFLGKEDPTFGEIIASPYILLGIVCTIVGIIWLLFLRSSIENKYPSYLSQPASSAASMGGNAVEMVPQSSAADAEQKQKNKQELQQAWNESDAE